MDGTFPDEVREGPSGSTAVEDPKTNDVPEGTHVDPQPGSTSTPGPSPTGPGGAVVPSSSDATLEEQAAQQSPAEAQSVPEGRPHSATIPVPSQRSDTDLRIESESSSQGMGPEAYERAASPEQAAAAAEVERTPIFLEGQRVQVIAGPNTGRMAYVSGHIFDDPAQKMLFYSAAPGKESAQASEYEITTRDGRADVLTVKPEEVKALEINNGWGRGSI